MTEYNLGFRSSSLEILSRAGLSAVSALVQVPFGIGRTIGNRSPLGGTPEIDPEVARRAASALEIPPATTILGRTATETSVQPIEEPELVAETAVHAASAAE